MPWTDPRTGRRDYGREQRLRAAHGPRQRIRGIAEQRVMRSMMRDPAYAGEVLVLLAAERSVEPVLAGKRRDAPGEWDKATARAVQRAMRALAGVHQEEFVQQVTDVEAEIRLHQSASGCTVGA